MNSLEHPESQQFSLEEFLTRIPPVDANGKQKYEEVIQKQAREHTNLGTRYSEQWYDILHYEPDVRKLLDEHTKDSILIDLGSGPHTEFANVGIKSAEYIAVDKFVEIEPEQTNGQSVPHAASANFPSELRPRYTNQLKPSNRTPEEQKRLGEAVMRAARGEPDSTNEPPVVHVRPKPKIKPGDPVKIQVQADMLDFLEHVPDNSCCITINGIDYNLGINDDYHKALATEMARVCKPGGIVFGVSSDSLNILKRNPDFEVLKESKNEHWLILKKKEKQNVEQGREDVHQAIQDTI